MQHARIVDIVLEDTIAAAFPGGDDDDDGRGDWDFAAAELSTGSCSML